MCRQDLLRAYCIGAIVGLMAAVLVRLASMSGWLEVTFVVGPAALATWAALSEGSSGGGDWYRGTVEASFRRAAPGGIAVLLIASGAVVGSASPASAQAPEETVALDAPWSFVTATESGAPEDVLGGIPGVEAVFRWNASAESFDTWRPGGLAILNSLRMVAPGDALWLLLASNALDATGLQRRSDSGPARWLEHHRLDRAGCAR